MFAGGLQPIKGFPVLTCSAFCRKESSNDKATSEVKPDEPVYPHLTQAIIAFCILGKVKNEAWCGLRQQLRVTIQY